jgi:hypothetical protein
VVRFVLPLGAAESHIYNQGTVRRNLQQEIQLDQESVYIDNSSENLFLSWTLILSESSIGFTRMYVIRFNMKTCPISSLNHNLILLKFQ